MKLPLPDLSGFEARLDETANAMNDMKRTMEDIRALLLANLKLQSFHAAETWNKNRLDSRHHVTQEELFDWAIGRPIE